MMLLYQSHLTIDDLPASMRDIAETIGLHAVLKLIDKYGGTECLYIPKRIKAGHPLAQLIGSDAVTKLAHLVGGSGDAGGEIEIPNAYYMKTKLRHKIIQQEKNKGATTVELARRYGITQRQIRRIVNG